MFKKYLLEKKRKRQKRRKLFFLSLVTSFSSGVLAMFFASNKNRKKAVTKFKSIKKNVSKKSKPWAKKIQVLTNKVVSQSKTGLQKGKESLQPLVKKVTKKISKKPTPEVILEKVDSEVSKAK